MHTDLVAALDIGGTKIAGALVDGDGTILARAQRPTPAQENGDTVMRAVEEVLGELTVSPLWGRAHAVGIGSAGPVDASAGTVSPVNVPGWRAYPLVERVRAATGDLPVELIGDGVAITAAEHWQGAARGHDNALCMVVSTGVGGGLVLGGRLHPGPTGNAGHIGHISVDLDGDACPCGARGCVERIASGPNIARRALENGWLPGPGRQTGQGGQQVNRRMQLRHIQVYADHPHRATAVTQDRADRFEASAIEVHLLIGADQRDFGAEINLVQQRWLTHLTVRKRVGDMRHRLGRKVVQHHLGLRLQEKRDGVAQRVIGRKGHGVSSGLLDLYQSV
jgi:predicted NBD/HSP70 family sugar kinase